MTDKNTHQPTLKIDLTNIEARDANVHLLPLWHPVFCEIEKEAIQFLDQFEKLMIDYKKMILELAPDSYEDLFIHVNEEVSMFFYCHMDEKIISVWKSNV